MKFASYQGIIAAVVFLGLRIPAFGADENTAVLTLARRFFRDSLYTLAFEQYQKYLTTRKSPDHDAEAHFNSAVCRLRTGRHGEAAQQFEEFLRRYPGDERSMEAMYQAGTARKARGDFKEASDWFYLVWNRFVGNARARYALYEAAWCAQRDKNPRRALDLYSVYVNRFPDGPDAKHAMIELIRLLVDEGAYDRAQRRLDTAFSRWERDRALAARLHYFAADLAAGTGKESTALEHFRKMEKADTAGFVEIIQAYRAYIDVLSGMKKFAESLPVFDACADIMKSRGRKPDRDFVFAWAENARLSKKWDVAIRKYRQLRGEDAQSPPRGLVLYRLAESLVGSGAFARAIETLERLSAGDFGGDYGVRALAKIGDLYYARDLYPSAIAAYRRYLRIPDAPDMDRILFRIGTIYRMKYHRASAALREFEVLVKQYPASSYYHRAIYAMAQCSEELGNTVGAIRHYSFLIESGAEDPLIEKARRRVWYLETFKITDPEAAVYALTGLLQSHAERSESDRLLAIADIYQTSLKDYHRALGVYEKIRASGESAGDSAQQVALFKLARINEILHGKAQYEQETQTASHYRSQAVALYNQVLQESPRSRFVDDAAFRLLVLTKPNIAEYEEFISRYSNSEYLPQTYLTIAEHYNKRAVSSASQFGKKAIEAYRSIVEQFPSSDLVPRALLGMGINYQRIDEPDSATRILKRLLSTYRATEFTPQALYCVGDIHLRHQRYERAIEAFKQILFEYPFSNLVEDARFELADAQFATGAFLPALANYRAYVRNHPRGKYLRTARYGIARCMARTGESEAAGKMLTALLAQKLPSSLAAGCHRELGEIARLENDAFSALEHYRKAIENDRYRNDAGLLRTMAALSFDNRLYRDAGNWYEKALRLAVTEADSIDFLSGMITSLIMDGRGRKADKPISYFKKRFGTHVDHLARIIYHEGLFLLIEKKYEKSRNRFTYILSRYGTTSWADDAAYHRALCAFYEDEKEKALDQFNRFMTQYPGSDYIPLAWFKIGMLYHGSDEFLSAAEAFVKVVDDERADETTRFRAANNAAVDYQRISSWLDAAAMFKRIGREFKEGEDDSEIPMKIGFCLVQASRFEEALEYFRKANENPRQEDRPEIIYWIATCHARLGEHRTAIAEYLKVPYLYSGSGKWGITAEFEAGRLYERIGEFEKARGMYRRVVETDGRQGRFGKPAAERLERIGNLLAEKR